MTPPVIRWDRIAHALDIYARLGFKYVEVPWTVSEEAVQATLPAGHIAMRTVDGPLVGSAEQSFLHMMLSGDLQPGRYVAATPCFRDDPPDILHQRMFLKVELIDFARHPMEADHRRLRALSDTALWFFRSLPEAREAVLVETSDGFDIELNRIELGSYGLRSFGGWHWVYGTGLAEPRLTVATSLTR